MDVRERIEALRGKMKEQGMKAYVVYSSDPHGSEYVSDHWKSRSWLSGFTGSAGTLVVTEKEAGLWTDFRYFIQAAEELEGSGVDLYKMGEPGVPEYLEWIVSRLGAGDVLGMDGRTLTLKEWEDMARHFTDPGILINGERDLAGEIWTDRPASAGGPVWMLSDEEAGESAASKIARLRDELRMRKIGATLIASLDDIAWVLNVRGSDVPYNPVVQSYLYVSGSDLVWFVDRAKVGGGVSSFLASLGLELRHYEEVSDYMASLRDQSLYLSPERINSAVMSVLSETVLPLKGVDLTTRMKAQKNAGEQSRLRSCMEKDGAAMVRFIRWIKAAVASGEKITELKAAAVLRDFRAGQEGFLSESFSTIPGYRAHGALCHYEAEEETQALLKPESLFLVDSGGQYREGTTDITRTLSLGEPSVLEKSDYTLVLKGHIALSRAVFPEGTRGYQLDLLARQPLWNAGLNYGHGTGHGVGYILNVHEGPQKISPHPIDEALLPGMVSSNEPGIYREGVHGIRIENLILTAEWDECPEGAGFLNFETLTLCPYDPSLIDLSLLDSGEKEWINNYHAMVLERISPLLNEEERAWLAEECREI